jgi:hypothetical protein
MASPRLTHKEFVITNMRETENGNVAVTAVHMPNGNAALEDNSGQ